MYHFSVKPISHRTHGLYKYGWPPVSTVHTNEPTAWPAPSYAWAIRVYPCKPCMIFKTTKTGTYTRYVRVWSYTCKRPYDTVRDRMRPCIYNRTWSPLHGWTHPCQYRIHINRTLNRTRPFPSRTSNTRSAHTVSYDHHTINTVQVRIIHDPVRLFTAKYDLTRPLCVHKACVRQYALEHNEKHN